MIRITLSPEEFANSRGELIFDLIAKFDLILGTAGSFSESVDVLISDLEIPDPTAFIMDLRKGFGSCVTVTGQLGIVSIVGFGLGSRPAAFLDASRLLHQAHIPVAKSFTTRQSLCFVVPASKVDEGVLLMHETFIQRSRPKGLFPAAHPNDDQKGLTA